MKVMLLVNISGTRNKQDWPTNGAVVELPDAEAQDLVASGSAAKTDKPVTHPDFGTAAMEPAVGNPDAVQPKDNDSSKGATEPPFKSPDPETATTSAPENAKKK